MKNKEQLAEQYAEDYIKEVYGEDSHYVFNTEIRYTKAGFSDGFDKGFSAKEKIVKESLNTLENLVKDINNLPLTEQIFKSRDLDRLNNKIEILKSLL